MEKDGKEKIIFHKQKCITLLSVLTASVILSAGLVFLIDFLSEASYQKKAEGRETMQILVLGDSIWDLERGETGIASLLEEELGNAAVYNCAVKGSRAAAGARYGAEAGNYGPGEIRQDDVCLYAMAEYLTGNREMNLPEDWEAVKTLSEVELSEMDYILIAYGLNDYFGAVKQKNPDDYFDITTYSGAMCSAVRMLKESCPDAEFVILSPTYCQGYAYGQVVQESTYYDYGGGTGKDYVSAAQEVTLSFDCMFVNNYEELGISIHNGAEYLEDATHLTEKGRRAYAENLAEHIKAGYRDGKQDKD